MAKKDYDIILNPFILLIAIFAILGTHIYFLLNKELVSLHAWINLISIIYISIYLWLKN